MKHRLRDIMHLDFNLLEGVVAVDETYFTPKAWRRTDARKRKQIAVVGIVEQKRGQSRVRVLVTKSADATTILPFIRASIKEGTKVHTDGSAIYNRLHHDFQHSWVNHSKWQWCDGEVTTNHIENFWSHLKRGIRGTYIHVSQKHLHRYADEFAFRFNTRHLSAWERFDEWFVGLDRRSRSIDRRQLRLFE